MNDNNLAEMFARHGRGTAGNGTVTAAYSELNDRDFIYYINRDLSKFSDMAATLHAHASDGGSAEALQYLASNRNIPYSLAISFLFCDDRFLRILHRSQVVFDFYDLQEQRLETVCRNCPEVETVLTFCALHLPSFVHPRAAYWGCVRSVRNAFEYTPTDVAFELGLWNTFTPEELTVIDSVLNSGRDEPCGVSHPLLSTQQLSQPLNSAADFAHTHVLEGCATAMGEDEQFDSMPAQRSADVDAWVEFIVENALVLGLQNRQNQNQAVVENFRVRG